MPFDLWITRGPRNFNHLFILIFFSGSTLLLRRECLGMDFTDGLRGLPHLPLGSYHDERGQHGARQKDEADKCSRCPTVSLVCLGPYVHSPLHTLLSLSFFPSVCSVLSGSDTVLSVWCAGCLLSSCHQAGLLVFIVVFVVFSFLSVVSRLCSLVKSVQSVLPVVCFFFRGCGTTSR